MATTLDDTLRSLELTAAYVKSAQSAYRHGRYATGDEKVDRLLRTVIEMAPDRLRELLEEA